MLEFRPRLVELVSTKWFYGHFELTRHDNHGLGIGRKLVNMSMYVAGHDVSEENVEQGDADVNSQPHLVSPSRLNAFSPCARGPPGILKTT